MSDQISVEIDLHSQCMTVRDDDDNVIHTYPVSTATNGPGQMMDSECTPTGKHRVRAKIGDGEAVNTVFRGRRPTGEIYSTGMRDDEPGRDWILTRILWLSGCEPGHNRLGDVDSMRRYIYIHGTPDEVDITTPGSRGCICMRNHDLLELYDLIPIGTPVTIHA